MKRIRLRAIQRNGHQPGERGVVRGKGEREKEDTER